MQPRTLTLPSLRDGSLPLPQAGEGLLRTAKSCPTAADRLTIRHNPVLLGIDDNVAVVSDVAR
jgi:hypothetical protein